jgi:O-antigen biosynthesis protein
MRTYGDFRLYNEWVQAHDTLGDTDRQAIGDSMRRLPRSPVFSIVLLPTPDGVVSAARTSVASVLRQLYPRWELWLPPGAEQADANADARLRIIQGCGTPTTDHASLFNAALAAAEGEFVLPLPPDTTLSEQAFYELAVAIGDDPEADLLYTDEDRVDDSGTRCMPHFKTGWDPDLALGRDAIGLLVAYRKALLERLGGMRSRSRGVALALYELSLRVAFAVSPLHIHHVPVVLCHRRGSSEASLGWDAEGAREIVRNHLAESGVSASVEPAPLAPGWNRVVREVPDPAPLVSIIVPTRDRAELLRCCAEAVLSRTDYPAIELLVVDNDSREPASIELFRRLLQDPRVRVLPCPGPFNYSALNNLAAREARGEVLVLLNNDTDSIRPDWLREIVSHAMRPDVGAVGVKLLLSVAE